jgi:hypothetical protein
MPESIASLMPTSRVHLECKAIFEALLCDVEWVLDALVAPKPVAQIIQSAAEQSMAASAGRKRKTGAHVAPNAPSKKARKSNV